LPGAPRPASVISIFIFNNQMEKTMTKDSTNTFPAIGDRMPDGTVFAGISPDTGRPMYATPENATLAMKWNRAMEYASVLGDHGRRDWRVPSENELNVLFNNRAAIGGFVTHGLTPQSWYWSSQQDKGLRPDICAVAQHFKDGEQASDYKFHKLSVRCVCG
jgi:hypothetical protein